MAKPKRDSPSRTKRAASGGRVTKEKAAKLSRLPDTKQTKKASARAKQQTPAANGVSRGQSQSCHQCRQSIYSSKGVSEVKYGKERLKCSGCTRFWCEQCLLNRYGLVKDSMDPGSWKCPVCQKKCNCSVCRKKEGKLATGILTPLAKNAGFQSVSDFLAKGTDDIAKVLQWKSPEALRPSASSRKKDSATSVHVVNSMKICQKRKRANSRKSDSGKGSTGGATTPCKGHGCHGDGGGGGFHDCHSKRRKLDHSAYNITLEIEDSLMEYTCGHSGGGTLIVEVEPDALILQTETEAAEPERPIPENNSKLEKPISKLEKPIPKLDKPTPKSIPEAPSPLRRSSRERKSTQRYSSGDFKVNLSDLSSGSESCESDDDDETTEDEEVVYDINTAREEESNSEDTSSEDQTNGNEVSKERKKRKDSKGKNSPKLPSVSPKDKECHGKQEEVSSSECHRKQEGGGSNSKKHHRKQERGSSSKEYHRKQEEGGSSSKEYHRKQEEGGSTSGENHRKQEEGGSSSGEWQRKQDELASLRTQQLNKIRRVIYEKHCEKLAMQHREAQTRRTEERKREQEQRSKVREQQKVMQKAAMEKVRLARSLLKEAQRDMQRRQRERERLNKQKQLEELKERKMAAKRRIQELTSFPIPSEKREIQLEDDSPESCDISGIPPLPSLPPLPFPIPANLVPSFFFVGEFLHTFQESLGLKKKLMASDLCQLLKSRRGLSEVYRQLLMLVMVEESGLEQELKSSKKCRDLEKLAKKYLQLNGRNGFVSSADVGQYVEESLVILNHLCHEVLETGCLDEILEESRSSAEQVHREQRAREREWSKEIGSELKKICEGGEDMVEKVESRRKEFTAELEMSRRSSEWRYYTCSLIVRNMPLGTDRHGRLYWRMQDSLHPRGKREQKLMDSLQLLEQRIKESFLSN